MTLAGSVDQLAARIATEFNALRAESGGGTPANMVTTDTTQSITGRKTLLKPIAVGANTSTWTDHPLSGATVHEGVYNSGPGTITPGAGYVAFSFPTIALDPATYYRIEISYSGVDGELGDVQPWSMRADNDYNNSSLHTLAHQDIIARPTPDTVIVRIGPGIRGWADAMGEGETHVVFSVGFPSAFAIHGVRITTDASDAPALTIDDGLGFRRNGGVLEIDAPHVVLRGGVTLLTQGSLTGYAPLAGATFTGQISAPSLLATGAGNGFTQVLGNGNIYSRPEDATALNPLRDGGQIVLYTNYWDGGASRSDGLTVQAVQGSATDGDTYLSVGGPIKCVGFSTSMAATRWVGGMGGGAPTAGAYVVGDWVVDRTGKIWICTVAGTPGTWVAVGTQDAASESAAGIIEIATQTETNTGTDDARSITPLKLQTRLAAYAQPLDSDLTAIAALTTTSYGRAFLELANQAALMGLIPAASETVQGKVELATDAETTTGTDASRATTPANVKAALDARLVSASETAQGIVELATTDEVTTGTDAARAVTPAGLQAKVANMVTTDTVQTVTGRKTLLNPIAQEVATGTAWTNIPLSTADVVRGTYNAGTDTIVGVNQQHTEFTFPSGVVVTAATRFRITYSCPTLNYPPGDDGLHPLGRIGIWAYSVRADNDQNLSNFYLYEQSQAVVQAAQTTAILAMGPGVWQWAEGQAAGETHVYFDFFAKADSVDIHKVEMLAGGPPAIAVDGAGITADGSAIKFDKPIVMAAGVQLLSSMDIASQWVRGVMYQATDAQAVAGSATGAAISPATLSSRLNVSGWETAQFSANNLTVGPGTFRFPVGPGTWTVDSVRAMVGTAPTGSSIIIDVNKNGTTIYSTQANRPAIAASANAATVGAHATTTLTDGDWLTVDIDQVGSTTPGTGLTVAVRLRRTA